MEMEFPEMWNLFYLGCECLEAQGCGASGE